MYILGPQIMISKKKYLFISLNIDLVLANSADPDEMPHRAAFHLGFHCLQKIPVYGLGLNSLYLHTAIPLSANYFIFVMLF